MEVKKISVFPFKSLKGLELQECEIDEYGMRYDRLYMLVHKNSNGEWKALTQRNEPAMARIATSFEHNKLLLEYNGNKVYLPLDLAEFPDTVPTIDVELWGLSMISKNVISEVPNLHKFFTDFFADSDSGTAKRINQSVVDGLAPNLGIVVSSERRVVPQTDLDQVFTNSFQDMFPGSLMTTASFDDLQRHVSVLSQQAKIGMDSFRMNLLVSTDEPWVEDDWKQIRIGDHAWTVSSPCERCNMPSVDQDTGKFRSGRHPLPSLGKFRILESGKSPCFGLNILSNDRGYKVKVGDKVRVLK